MKKAITIIGMIVTTCAFATDDGREITTSQRYVETQLSNRQDTIPAKSGDKVVTPTSTKGTIGEREIKTALGDEMTNQNDTGITTVATVNTAVYAKQNKIPKLPSVNVVTYTGTRNGDYSGAGIVTSTPVYDENVNTYGNGLVRAETLNTAVQRGVSRALTQVPAGFVINKIGDVLPTTVYVNNVDDGKDYCFKNIDPGIYPNTQGTTNANKCSDTMFSSFALGDWGITYDYETGISYPGDTCTGNKCYEEIHGISACISQTFSGKTIGAIAPKSLSATLQAAYENSRDGSTPPGSWCYCKVVNPHIGSQDDDSPWVSYYNSVTTPTGCARICARGCAVDARTTARFRGALFGGVSAD